MGKAILLFAAAAAYAFGQIQLPAADAGMIRDAYDLWKSSGDRVWPGWTSVRIPMVYVTASHEFAIGFPSPLKGFEPGASSDAGTVQTRARQLPPNLAASFPFEGVPAAILGTPEALERTREHWIITATHEMFHVYEMTRGSIAKIAALEIGPAGDSSWQLNYPFPYADPNAMALVHLQGYLSFLAAIAPNSDDARYNLSTALEAARAYTAMLKPKDAAYSKFQEWNEGVAAYTEYRMAELAKSRSAEFQKLWDQTYRDRIYLAKHAGRAAKSRTAFYHLGTAKALALDKTLPEWKSRFFEPGVWLDDLLAQAAELAVK